MKVTYNWLKEFVDFDLPPAELGDLLTMLGLEVEGTEALGCGMDQLVTARVVEKNQHPNADKLSLCRIDNGKEIISVVCGAQNFQQGDTVALAQVGSVLPGDFKIKRSKIRGEESCGMLCSEKELGLAEESSGIMVLDDSLPLGIPFFEAIGIKDTIFEIGLTPNRADCLSVVGIAREIAAKLGKRVRYPSVVVPEYGEPVNSRISVMIQDPVGCPRYAARYISGCKIAPSPKWLVNRLNAVGVRSINNVVDITNLVMIELGHPLHAFDYTQVAGGQIIVRRAKEGEIFRTLDAQERTLLATDLMICDKEKAVALAGIMGGENSEITDATTDILIESAFFDPPAIRRTSKRLGLHTESSHRFERGADIQMVPKALDRAASLIAQLANGSVANGQVDNFPTPKTAVSINFRPEKANAILGLTLSSDRMAELFRNLEFQVKPVTNGSFQVTIPSYRIDIEREIDLVEEICRLNGFDQVPATIPIAQVISDRPNSHQKLQKTVRNHFVSEGMHEIISFSFISPDAADRLLLGATDIRRNSIKLCNPLALEQSVMRTTLLPGLLETAARNISFRSLDLRLFEMRRVYLPVPEQDMPTEPIFSAGIFCGSRDQESWCNQTFPIDFYDIKGVIDNLFNLLNITNVTWSSDLPEPFYHPGKCCNILSSKGESIGSIGEIHPEVLKNYDIERTLYYFELNFEQLVNLSSERKNVIPPSRFPDSVRDLALLSPDNILSSQFMDCIKSLKLKELEDVTIFDIYQGEHLPKGSKSVALRLRYRALDRTMTDDEVQVIHSKIIKVLTEKLNVSVR